MSWFKRYRHSKGFGIHSPFAYRFITEVLEERLPYYDFDVIQDRVQRLIYRIACRLQPTAIKAIGNAELQAAHMACPKASINVGTPQLAVASGEYNNSEIWDILSQGCRVIILKPKQGLADEAKAQMDKLGYGMTFDNERSMLILVPNPKLPRQDFTVRF